MSKRSKTNRWALPLMLLMGAAAGTVALALYVKMTPADRVRPVEERRENPIANTPKKEEGITVLIPVAKRTDGNLTFDQSRFVTAPGTDARIEAVNEFLRSSSVLDASIKLKQINLEDGLAELHFSEGLDSGQGSMDEGTLIQGLRAVLGQFPEVKRFTLFTDGHEVKELGHFELGDPIDTLPVDRWGAPSSSDETAPPPSMPR